MVERVWYPTDKIFIGGAWREATDHLPAENPSTSEQIGRIARGGAAEIDAAVAAAEAARRGAGGRMTATERGRLPTRIGRLVAARVDDLSRNTRLDPRPRRVRQRPAAQDRLRSRSRVMNWRSGEASNEGAGRFVPL